MNILCFEVFRNSELIKITVVFVHIVVDLNLRTYIEMVEINPCRVTSFEIQIYFKTYS